MLLTTKQVEKALKNGDTAVVAKSHEEALTLLHEALGVLHAYKPSHAAVQEIGKLSSALSAFVREQGSYIPNHHGVDGSEA